MLQNVLVASQGECLSTKEPMSILHALFPMMDLSTDDSNPSVALSQWIRMLKEFPQLDSHVQIKPASEVKLTVYPKPHYGDKDGFLPCFVKAETLRKSSAGSVQVHQVGRLDVANACVHLVEPAQFVVIKVFDMSKASQVQENPLSEIALHSKLMMNQCGSVIPLLGCLATPERLFVVFPMCPEGDMFKFLSESPTKLCESQVRIIMQEMLKGVGHCHANYICHRDVSLENFLKHGNELALIDFGLSVEMDALSYLVPNNGPVGKTKYMAPELAIGKGGMVDGRKLDVWSLGVTLFMLITQTEPFHVALNADERYRLLITKKGMRSVFASWNIAVSPLLMDLLEAMLNPDSNQRPTVQQILAHPWMAVEA